jgi:hypothetical protein
MHRADNLASLSLSDIRRKYAVFLLNRRLWSRPAEARARIQPVARESNEPSDQNVAPAFTI